MEDDTFDTPLQANLYELLGWLCVEWGFCIPFDDAERIAASTHLDADSFAAEVLKADGVGMEMIARWKPMIAARFAEHFSSTP